MPKPRIVRAIHANRGVEAAYRAAMLRLVQEMAESVEYWLMAQYKKSSPLMAQDELPSDAMQKRVHKLFKQWKKKFEAQANPMAELYVGRAFSTTSRAFQMALKDAGWTVNMKMTRQMRDSLNASIGENVGLIRSIPEHYLNQVEGMVMRAYAAGGDMQQLTRDLRTLYPQAKRRIETIARDQNNKASAVVVRARRVELGITDAIWLHSHGGKEPRPTHVAMSGKRFKVADGMWDSAVKKMIQPGEEINCRCVSRAILPF